MALLEIKDLERTFSDETRALRGVSFSIAEGEFVAIMGPSGSGKSTLLHILGLLDKETGGEYRFDGTRIKDLGTNEEARLRNTEMGFVFQMFHLLARASVRENVKLPLLYSSVPESEWDARADEAISAVGLSHRARQDASRLSGGEKQRVAIARALVTRPRVIFADEPTGNLDSASGAAIMAILAKLNNGGKTIILITHETYTAEYAERILHMKDGTLVLDEKVAVRRTEFRK
ncbi:MAG: ABC transporter ATP-binding protein [Parcubacteria group bacterium]|nr:ABC transporter ATP-binding protein [Parcubacteria group bacterium]